MQVTPSAAQRARVLDVHRHHGDVRDVDVRRRGFAAANSGLSLSVENQQRKSSYAVAEAGLGYYLKELRENPDVWAQCATADAPNPTEKSPINQQWDGVGHGPAHLAQDPGRPGGVHDRAAAHGRLHEVRDRRQQAGLADRHVQRHVPDPHHRPRDRGPLGQALGHRHLQARRLPEVRVLHRPGEPRPAGRDDRRPSARRSRPSASTSTARRATARAASEIQFATGDAINGPLHTNDENLLICGTPIFGREKTKTGATAKTDVDRGLRRGARLHATNGSSCDRHAEDLLADRQVHDRTPSRSSCRRATRRCRRSPRSGGRVYAGKTIIRLKDSHDGRHQLPRPARRRPRTTSRGPTTASSTSRTTAPATARSRPTPTTTSPSLRQRLRQRHLLEAADDRRRQRRDRPPDRRTRKLLNTVNDSNIVLTDG